MTSSDESAGAERPRADPDGPFESIAATRAARSGSIRGADALLVACAEAGVRLGRFDRRVLEELGRLDRDTVFVVASIIRRAGEHSR